MKKHIFSWTPCPFCELNNYNSHFSWSLYKVQNFLKEWNWAAWKYCFVKKSLTLHKCKKGWKHFSLIYPSFIIWTSFKRHTFNFGIFYSLIFRRGTSLRWTYSIGTFFKGTVLHLLDLALFFDLHFLFSCLQFLVYFIFGYLSRLSVLQSCSVDYNELIMNVQGVETGKPIVRAVH